MKRLVFRGIVASAALASPASAGQPATYWLAPRDGDFNDPTRWSDGVPTSGQNAVFGTVGGGPFVVTIDGAPNFQQLNVTSQTFALIGGRAGAAITTQSIGVSGDNSDGSLTLKNCFVECNSVALGWSAGGAELHLTESAVLSTNDLIVFVPAFLDLGAHATANVGGLGMSGVTRWTIDGTDACHIDARWGAWIDGTIRIAFGPRGRPAPGTIIPLVTSTYPIDEECTKPIVVVEPDGRGPNDAVVSMEAGALVYRQLTAPLALSLSVPALMTVGWADDVALIGTGDGHAFDVARQAVWTSSNERVLHVIEPGRVAGMRAGSAMLTATLGSSSVSAIVNVVADNHSLTPIDNDECAFDYCRGMTRDGRFVLFDSTAESLIAEDTNGIWDVFLRDADTGAIERVSVGPNNEQGTESSQFSAISGDGRFVAFTTSAPEVSGNGYDESLVLKDRETGAIETIATRPDSLPYATYFFNPLLSFDGRFVAFQADVFEGDSVTTKAFLRDRLKGTTTLIGLGVDGTPLEHSVPVAMSSDGRFIAFVTAPGYTEGFETSLLLRDAVAQTTQVVIDHGYPTYDWPQPTGAISDDGQLIAFSFKTSWKDNTQLLLRNLADGSTTVITTWTNEQSRAVAMTPDGRYVAFHDSPVSLCPVATPAQRFDRLTGTQQRIDVRPDQPPGGTSWGNFGLSGDGRFCALTSILEPFGHECVQVFRRDFAVAAVGDINADGVVDASDLALLIAAWGTNDASADLDGDGGVGAADLTILLGAWTG